MYYYFTFFPGQTIRRLCNRNAEYNGKGVHTYVGNAVSFKTSSRNTFCHS